MKNRRECTCTVPHPMEGEPTFDSACLYHGDNGTMVTTCRFDYPGERPKLTFSSGRKGRGRAYRLARPEKPSGAA